MPQTARKSTTAIGLKAEHLEALRQICRELALGSGAPAPGDPRTLDEVIAALAALTARSHESPKTVPATSPEARDVQAELENLERLKSRFIRNVSHELRTPLASIDGFARALLRMESPEGARANGSNTELVTPEMRRQFLAIISQEAQRLGKFIEDVLDLSEIESNRVTREATLFNTRELVADALKAVVADSRTLNVNIRLTPEPDGPAIYADRDAIVEVLRQLISNAQKYSAGQDIVLSAERVSISPNLAAQATTSGQLPRITTATRLYVRDRGVGIPKDELERVFQKFYRIERPGFTVPGTGLGLSIVRALVNQNNGQVWAESDVGRGCTFYVLLPDHAPGID